MAPAQIGFLDLARELRDLIYIHYVTIDGGYIFNPDSCKLRTATPFNNHLALQRTCKLIADEMRGLALTHNIITISTVDSWRERAHFHGVWTRDCQAYEMYMVISATRHVEGCITPRVRESVARRFPECRHAVDEMAAEPVKVPELARGFGLAPSLHSAFIHFLLQCISHGSETGSEMVSLGYGEKPWAVPSHDELDHVAKVIKRAFPCLKDYEEYGPLIDWDGLQKGDRTRFSFSAAAVAILFLQSMPTSIRLLLRRIVLNEDHRAVAYPQCHGKGLIPFCVENPQLRIERHVNLLTNCWLNHVYIPEPWDTYDPAIWGRPSETLEANSGISSSVAEWVMEALALPSSISLVLDGGPAPELSSEIFNQVIVRDAIWQMAVEKGISRQIIQSWDDWDGVWEWRRARYSYVYGYILEDFPQAIQDIGNGSSPIRCNFDVVEFDDKDAEELLDRQKGWSDEEWHEAWNGERNPKRYDPAPPLPSWRTLTEQTWLPESE